MLRSVFSRLGTKPLQRIHHSSNLGLNIPIARPLRARHCINDSSIKRRWTSRIASPRFPRGLPTRRTASQPLSLTYPGAVGLPWTWTKFLGTHLVLSGLTAYTVRKSLNEETGIPGEEFPVGEKEHLQEVYMYVGAGVLCTMMASLVLRRSLPVNLLSKVVLLGGIGVAGELGK